jgi:hypothetical protein
VGSSERKRSDTFREGNASKGKSQGRCQGETNLARVRREKTVERVAKPGGRNVFGQAKPEMKWTFVPAMCRREAKLRRGVRSPSGGRARFDGLML